MHRRQPLDIWIIYGGGGTAKICHSALVYEPPGSIYAHCYPVLRMSSECPENVYNRDKEDFMIRIMDWSKRLDAKSLEGGLSLSKDCIISKPILRDSNNYGY